MTIFLEKKRNKKRKKKVPIKTKSQKRKNKTTSKSCAIYVKKPNVAFSAKVIARGLSMKSVAKKLKRKATRTLMTSPPSSKSKNSAWTTKI